MTINELKRYLAKHGIKEGSLYTIEDASKPGFLEAIKEIDGKWYTYLRDKDENIYYQEWPSEAEAVEYIRHRVEVLAKGLGLWKA